MMDDLQRRVAEWGEQTFPDAHDAGIWQHLREEVDELRAALMAGDQAEVAQEAADIVMMLFHLAHRGGFSLQRAVEAKFTACQQREWLPPDASGVVRHRR